MRDIGLRKKYLIRKGVVLSFCLVILITFVDVVVVSAASPDNDTGSVYGYAINSAAETGPGEVTVQDNAESCPYCNSNSSDYPESTDLEAFSEDDAITIAGPVWWMCLQIKVEWLCRYAGCTWYGNGFCGPNPPMV